MGKEKKTLTEEEKRLLEFAHYCRQTASAENLGDIMCIVPLQFERKEGNDVCNSTNEGNSG